MTKSKPLALALATLGPTLAAPAPNDGVFTYSGYLRKSDGAPETAAQSLTFALYDVAANGTAAWTQTVAVSPDSQGWFAAVLMPTAALEAQLASKLWLGVTVAGEPEMAPRTPLGSALQASSVDWAGVLNRPAACGAGQYLSGFDAASGAALCSAPPGGGALPACPAGALLRSNGTGWVCAPDAGGPSKFARTTSFLGLSCTCATTYGTTAAMTLNPAVAGDVVITMAARYNFDTNKASQITAGFTVTTSSVPPGCGTGLDAGSNAGWAQPIAATSAFGDLSVAVVGRVPVAAGATYFVWLGGTRVNYDCGATPQSGTLAADLVATLYQPTGL